MSPQELGLKLANLMTRIERSKPHGDRKASVSRVAVTRQLRLLVAKLSGVNPLLKSLEALARKNQPAIMDNIRSKGIHKALDGMLTKPHLVTIGELVADQFNLSSEDLTIDFDNVDPRSQVENGLLVWRGKFSGEITRDPQAPRKEGEGLHDALLKLGFEDINVRTKVTKDPVRARVEYFGEHVVSFKLKLPVLDILRGYEKDPSQEVRY